ncbi:hypothetical protein BDK51DRAFT_30938 [Blyttiomyces helicus]|uniref:BTB domain-containing protein n=1 Tax=Blyttiomyces helicus TaxID=388810 RepID=A0A4P9WML6_9FUNG|nr:hypothetical protein BDK51DRAFT_30938 [Blyttiomyces helicus]|eukprot:RKO92420.1 hypothetical protein BDK51DRAFT_30938 [Blyttiomyces helicus]
MLSHKPPRHTAPSKLAPITSPAVSTATVSTAGSPAGAVAFRSHRPSASPAPSSVSASMYATPGDLSTPRRGRSAPSSRATSISGGAAGENEEESEPFRAAVFADAWDSGLFSDIRIRCLGRMYALHRVVMMQSPFLRRLLLDDHNQELVIVEGFLTLEFGNDKRISKEGMEIALRDLYDPPNFPSRRAITHHNALTVLLSACFLELPDLCLHCTNATILATMDRESAVAHARSLDALVRSGGATSLYGPSHRFAALWNEHKAVVEEAVLSYLVQAVNYGLSQSAGRAVEGQASADKEPEEEAEPREVGDNLVTAEGILSALPSRWVRRVLACDALCVPGEFARYELVKRVLDVRARSKPRGAGDAPSDDWGLDRFDLDEAGVGGGLRCGIGMGIGNSVRFGTPVSVDGREEEGLRRGGRQRRVKSRRVSEEVAEESQDALEDEDAEEDGEEVDARTQQRGGDGDDDEEDQEDQEDKGAESEEEQEEDEEEPVTQSFSGLSGYFGSLLRSVMPSRGSKRKARDSDDEESTVKQARTSRDRRVRAAPAPPCRAAPLKRSRRSASVASRTSTSSRHKTPPVAPAPRESPTASLLRATVVYNYMSFHQLEAVKRDRIVPTSIVLHSFWMQAELADRRAGMGARGGGPNLIAAAAYSPEPGFGPVDLPPFRFAARFRGVRAHFAHGGKGKARAAASASTSAWGDHSPAADMLSDPVVCAGVQYRVLLSPEEPASPSPQSNEAAVAAAATASVTDPAPGPPMLRALLQRTHATPPSAIGATSSSATSRARRSPFGGGEDIAYAMHAFDPHAFTREGSSLTWETFHRPVTACSFQGCGHVRPFPIPDEDGQDDMWIIVTIKFR